MVSYRHRNSSIRRGGGIFLLAVVLAVVLGARTIASFIIEYHWWKEIDQLQTWLSMLLYGVAPVAGAALLCFVVLWVSHARGMRFAGERLRYYPTYAKLATAGLFLLGCLIALISIDSWAVVRFFGGRGLTSAGAVWQDPVFGNPLRYYFFDLPFYSVILRLIMILSLASAVLYWITARVWSLRRTIGSWAGPIELDLRDLRLGEALKSKFVRTVGALFLFTLAASFYLDRYNMLFADHGFLVGVDYVAEKITLPLQWLTIATFAGGAVALLLGHVRVLLVLPLVLLLKMFVPPLVNSIFVRPNEISMQRPYIERHIEATRSAFGLTQRAREIEFPAKLEADIDPSQHKALLENVRLWDWRAFHDTVAQIQALRPYYVFQDSDVDRYIIDGQLRQVMLTPRELDVRQLGDARARWINTHFIYTHGYGMVMAEANRITEEGLPVMLVQDAPPRVLTQSLKLSRPELYFGEVTHEPVYVRTAQPEFDYPQGADNAHTRYEGKGGIPISSFPMKLAAAMSRGDWNLLLTSYLTPESRMLIRRNIKDRVETVAGFLHWDPDPYLVLTEDGRLVWIIDGYTTSQRHPYSRLVSLQNVGVVNYMRNSVKATIDAYDGTVRLYVFEPGDPIIQAYQTLFPNLLLPASALPEDLRRHVRYPELIFRTQAEIYRTFHMRDPEAFYNKEDLWDIGRTVHGRGLRPEPVNPTYVVATLPDSSQPEFLLILPFTPRNKDNLLGLMVARCDGEHLGELVFLQLSKQQLILGPMQIDARINQDQIIAKDLALWNQQGSQVLRGQMLVLPIEDTFLYIEPIYIQASEARMPQLKKVVVAMGNRLFYTDTYEEALQQLGGIARPAIAKREDRKAPEPAVGGDKGPRPPVSSDATLEAVRQHLRRYRELSSQGRWAEAGKELEALEAAVSKLQ